ncbi:hypothetical protein PBAL39_24760 [Pedobacter sp. BAL39]|uniref:Rv1355c family protein n=1 Tax=Pedobacter sp. BAL39 TaxID=391596 RepID=UPI0001559CFC|nr:Rv1355c family protein [Pedobacter sp. BAL39]EDM36538.1 hypothetical protein PBAL39_24760 [Pedobacter sp. BAL39]
MFQLENPTQEDHSSYEPQFFRIYNAQDKLALEELLTNNPAIRIHDELHTQLDDLIKSKHPKRKPEPQELEKLRAEHIGNLSMTEYGVWVYYPWSLRLVHLLDEDEFMQVRTNRNIYKITPEERDLLGQQKVGVVGLSVGQSVSITMAMERSFKEIRLADFDTLELTNINRIRTGVHNLGTLKVIIVAREIKEIDPFLKVVIFPDGLTEENMDRFFSEGGNLDMVVDEADGLDIKIHLRIKAKALGIPVIMDMSDRGTVDVERFDLEPDRPILHGMIDHLDPSKIKDLKTNEEKVPYLLAMIGIDTLSARLKASMVEVGQSITTWPQLASAVALGGALCADVHRRIILGKYHESGRYFVDIEEQISDKKPAVDQDYDVVDLRAADLTDEEIADAIKNIPQQAGSIVLTEAQTNQLVTAAILAPSAGNNQPWKWVAGKGQLFLFHDEKHSVSWGDFDNITSNIAFGTAIENLKIEASKLGLQPAYQLFPNADNKRLVAHFSFSEDKTPYLPELAPGIGLRLTNRKKGTAKLKLDEKAAAQLTDIVSFDSEATLELIQDDHQIDQIANIVAGVERVRFLYPQGHHDFYSKEIRWTDDSVNSTKDGLDVRSMELSESDKTGLFVASNPEVIKLLNKWGKGTAFEKLSRTAIESSSAIGLISMPEYNAENFIKGGEAVQRAWINANMNGLSVHPISAPLFLFARLNHGNGEGLTERMKEELTKYQRELLQIFPSLAQNQGIFMFRLSHADDASVRSVRKPLENVLKYT